MVERSRRKLLAALAGVTAIAGCSGEEPSTATDSERPSESPSATPTDSATEPSTPTESSTPTPEPIDASDLAFAGSVVRQPSEEAPGKVRASLTNQSGRHLTLSGGAPAPVDRLVEDGPDDALLLLPDEADRINDYYWNIDGAYEPATLERATYDGCWHAPTDELVQTAMADTTELPHGETVAADFSVLARASVGCPEGRYTVGSELLAEGSGQFVQPQLTINIDADGRLAAEGSLAVDDA